MRVVSIGSPDRGGGFTVILYVTSSAFGGGVHSIVTVELVVPLIKLVSLTFLGCGTV